MGRNPSSDDFRPAMEYQTVSFRMATNLLRQAYGPSAAPAK